MIKQHILYIHQYFKTPYEAGANRSYWISKYLVDNGFKVTVITSSNKIGTPVIKRNIDGINVIYCSVSYSQKMSVFSRFIAFFRFMIKSSYISMKIKDIDLIYATSTPLSVGFPALLIHKIKKLKYVFEVRDLWPEVPIQMGALKNPFLINLIKLFEKNIYLNAEHIIALSPGMKNGVIQSGIEASKVTVIPNMAKIDKFWIRNKNNKLYTKYNLDKNKFKVVHFGSMGIANNLDYILECATLLSENDQIEFIFIGEGSEKNKLIKRCNLSNLKNVKFLGNYNTETLSEIINLCDISIVSFLNLKILYTNSPNKLFDSLSAGKPIIVNSNGWTRKLVEKNNCGFYTNPESPNDLVEKILLLKNDKVLFKTMQKNSRKLAETKFDKKILFQKILYIVKKSL